MIQKFRKKPVVIEAVQWNVELKNFDEVMNFMQDFHGNKLNYENAEQLAYKNKQLYIKTLEGVMTASNLDWIIKGVSGEFYPCKNDIFLMTYDVVIPKDVEDAQRYITECGKDIGFMGSPEYYRQKEIVNAYFNRND